MTQPQTLTLTAFLLARITEDEVEAANATTGRGGMDGMQSEVLDWQDGAFAPSRVLAECEAKRRLLAECGDEPYGNQLHRVLAAPYADHPDYRDEWRP